MGFDVPELCLDWIIPGKLAALACPFDNQLELVAQLGIKVLISLNETPPPTVAVAKAGMEHVKIPVPNRSAPSMEKVRYFVEVVREAMKRGKPVGVHCLAGVGRTGTMLACYFVSEGMEAQQAIDHVRRLRPGAIETDGQEAAVWEWWARVNAARPPGR